MRISDKESILHLDPDSALNSFTDEKSASLPHGWAGIRKYVWDHPTHDAWTSSHYFIDMPLTPRSEHNWAMHVDSPRAQRTPLSSLWFVPPGCRVESGSGKGVLRTFHLSLTSDMVDGLLEEAPDWPGMMPTLGFHLAGSDIRWLLTCISRELQQPGLASSVLIESLTQAVAVAIARSFHGCRAMGQAPFAGGLAPWRMQRIRDRVHADLPAPKLDELAALCDLSVRHLSRAFRLETGQTIAAFVQGAMIERARAKLANPRRPLGDIAKELGFASASSFAYAFHRATGLRPGDLRSR